MIVATLTGVCVCVCVCVQGAVAAESEAIDEGVGGVYPQRHVWQNCYSQKRFLTQNA